MSVCVSETSMSGLGGPALGREELCPAQPGVHADSAGLAPQLGSWGLEVIRNSQSYSVNKVSPIVFLAIMK